MKEYTITVGQLLAMYQEAKKLMSKDMQALLAYKISRIAKAIEPTAKTFEEQRKKVAEKKGMTQEKLVKELQPLLEEKEALALPSISLDLFNNTEATPRFFEVFDPIIEGE